MASATGISESAVAAQSPREEGLGEDEPLLGNPGDVTQNGGRGLYYNTVIGKDRLPYSETPC
jgi:hypothetical protein